MAQKSLPILNKVNTSMIWYTTYYFKYYKWLSSQNLYLLYFFNKLFVYLDFLFFNLMWLNFYTVDLYSSTHKIPHIRRIKQRFFKPITSYLVTLNTKSIYFNLFYRTSLEKFQSRNDKPVIFRHNFYTNLLEVNRVNRLYFR